MKTVVITWTSSGIWLACARAFLSRGHKVIGISRSIPEKLEPHDLYEHHLCDLSQNFEPSEFWIELCDILINNAGILSHHTGIEAYDADTKSAMYALHIDTPLKLIAFFMEKNKALVVLNMASMAAHMWNPDLHYGITKAAILNYTKSLASLYGKSGLRINALAPGPVDTKMLDVISQDRKNSIPSLSLSQEFNMPEHVASVALWLALDAPQTINGSTIDINDGMYVR